MGVIYLIRHGRPVIAGVLLGSCDVALASEELAASVLTVDRVFSSPLVRARRTAELLFPCIEVFIIPEWKERGLGEWERRSWVEVEAGWPELAMRANADWFGTTPPGGETWWDFVARVQRGWLVVPRSGSTAIVAHAGVNAVLAHLIAGQDFAAFQQDYLEVLSFAVSD